MAMSPDSNESRYLVIPASCLAIVAIGDNSTAIMAALPAMARELRLEVEACGICHSDVMVKHGLWPGLAYPRIPGHEIAGRVDACGADVANWKVGQRVGVGWHGGHCFTCEVCRTSSLTPTQSLRPKRFSDSGARV